MTMHRLPLLVGLVVLGLSTVQGQQTQPPPPQGQGQVQGGQGQGGRGQRGGQGQARDRTQQQLPQGTGSIAGRILTADTGRPVKRARVTVSGGGRGGRTTTTDDQGRYQVGELAAGNYNVTASKNGFVNSVYGQRRPQQ